MTSTFKTWCGLAVLHDEHDRITKAEHSWLFAEGARHAGAQAHTIAMRHGCHTMLRGARHWHRLTTDLVGAILDRTPMPTHGTRRGCAADRAPALSTQHSALSTQHSAPSWACWIHEQV
ncbi:hypothetical protein ACWDHW_09740 [Streptomyces melanosporofaciens]